MTPVVVDTDVVSFAFKNDTRAELFKPLIDGRINVLSVTSVGELRLWAEIHRWGPARRQKLSERLAQFVVVPMDEAIAEVWSIAMAKARRTGRPLAAADGWIAATAISLGLPLVTNNRRHFEFLDDLEVQSI